MKLNLRHRIIYDFSNRVILFMENADGETVTSDTANPYLRGFESNNIVDIYDFIEKNNLITNEEVQKLNPFDSDWSQDYPDAKLRMYLKSIDANRLSIDMPEFVMYLKTQNINLEVDENYGVVWAYLEFILDEHKGFLEAIYNAKFQDRNI
jgi:hypothetical protein